MGVRARLFYQQEADLGRLHVNSCDLLRFRSESGESWWALLLLVAATLGEATAHEDAVRAPGDLPSPSARGLNWPLHPFVKWPL